MGYAKFYSPFQVSYSELFYIILDMLQANSAKPCVSSRTTDWIHWINDAVPPSGNTDTPKEIQSKSHWFLLQCCMFRTRGIVSCQPELGSPLEQHASLSLHTYKSISVAPTLYRSICKLSTTASGWTPPATSWSSLSEVWTYNHNRRRSNHG